MSHSSRTTLTTCLDWRRGTVQSVALVHALCGRAEIAVTESSSISRLDIGCRWERGAATTSGECPQENGHDENRWLLAAHGTSIPNEGEGGVQTGSADQPIHHAGGKPRTNRAGRARSSSVSGQPPCAPSHAGGGRLGRRRQCRSLNHNTNRMPPPRVARDGNVTSCSKQRVGGLRLEYTDYDRTNP